MRFYSKLSTNPRSEIYVAMRTVLYRVNICCFVVTALYALQISVLPHGMDDHYLQKLMDKLTDLYLESSEIQFKQLKLTS